jgi:hypothetical protein
MFATKAWKVTATKNTLTGNNGGFSIVTKFAEAQADLSSATFHIPTGSVTYNDFSGNTIFGMVVADATANSKVDQFKSTGEYVASTGTGADLVATHNWWGHFLGPKGAPDNWNGRGTLASTKLKLHPFLSCFQTDFCVSNTDCTKTTAY